MERVEGGAVAGVAALGASLRAAARRAGVEAVLDVLVEAHRPFCFLYAQAAYAAVPHMAPYVGGGVEDLADWLEAIAGGAARRRATPRTGDGRP
jgi:hypothetical protein